MAIYTIMIKNRALGKIEVIKDTINSVVNDGVVHFDSVNLTDEEMQSIDQVYIVACGSAYHVGVALQYDIESLTSLQVRVVTLPMS